MSFASSMRISARFIPLAILLLLGLVWGSVTNIARYVGSAGVPPVSYAFWTLAIGALILTVVNISRRQIIPVSRQHVTYYIASGLASSALPTANMFNCLNHISVGAMSLALATVPLVTYLLAVLFGLEPRNFRRAVGIAFGLAGALIVILPDNGMPTGESPLWFMAAFLTPIGYATGTIITAKYRPYDVDALVGANGMMIASASALLVLALSIEDLYPIWASMSRVNDLIVIHGALSAIAFTLFFTLVRLAGPVYFSQVAYLVAFFGIAIAMLIFGERYSLWMWLALAITIVGVWLVNSAQHRVTVQSAEPADT